MIVDAAGMQQLELILACDTSHVREETQLKIRRNDPATIFRTKNTMKELADVGVCHIVFQSSLTGLFLVFKDTHR